MAEETDTLGRRKKDIILCSKKETHNFMRQKPHRVEGWSKNETHVRRKRDMR